MLRLTLHRRDWLRIGLSGLGCWPALATAATGERAAYPGFGKARSVILIYASGGQSQLDMWDPKPHAPAEVRGEFSPIATAVPGVQICEHLPRLAQLANRFSILRSLSHEDLDHGSATYLALTGRYHARRSSNPPPSPSDFPSHGAVYSRVRPGVPLLYDAVHVNGPALVPTTVAPGQDGGFLGRGHAPLVVGDVSSGSLALPGLDANEPLPPLRFSARRSLKETLDSYRRQLAQCKTAAQMSALYQRAAEMLATPRYRTALDLGAESPQLRDRYGRHRSGQACLLARRLVEAEIPWITVIWNHTNRGQDFEPHNPEVYGWDTHNDIFSALQHHLLPRFDASFSALLEDLDDRGLLSETLVICLGEFGRAPRVAFESRFAGRSPGRKHWSTVYSMVAAGAGVSQGAVVGASDRMGAEPASERFGPWDVAATMFSALGIDPAQHYVDSLQRPFAVTVGQPISELYRG